MLKTIQAITRNVQIKGASKLLWNFRAPLLNSSHVYNVTNDLRLYIDETQLYQWWYVINYSAFDLILLFQRVLRQGDCVLDVGANIGFTSLHASRLVGASGRVFAFEPSDETFRQLMTNVQLNSVDNVVCLQIAISNIVGDEVFIVATDAGLSRLHNNQRNTFGLEPAKTINVAINTLDNVWNNEIAQRHVRLLKIDIEGHELAAIRGAERLLTNGCDFVICEMNDELLRQNCVGIKDIIATMAEYHFLAYWIWSHSADWFRLGRLPSFRSIDSDDVNAGRGKAVDCLFVHERVAHDFDTYCRDLIDDWQTG